MDGHTDADTDAYANTFGWGSNHNLRHFSYGGPVIDPGLLNFTDLTDQDLAVTVTSNTVTIAAGMTKYQKVFAGNGAEVNIETDIIGKYVIAAIERMGPSSGGLNAETLRKWGY